MAMRLAVQCLIFLAMNIPSAWASDAAESGGAVAAPEIVAALATSTVGAAAGFGAVRTFSEPSMSPRLSKINRRKISSAFELAFERVRDVPECREMFGELGTDGVDVLSMVFFRPIGRAQSLGNVCGSGKAAYTLVGGGPIWVCRHFRRLSDTQAAMVIIHEALHNAGLTEYPQDPDGMTSTFINQMVMTRCGL